MQTVIQSASSIPAASAASMVAKKVSESEVVLLHSPMPDETNDAGMMHGGHLLKLIDNAGGIVARRHARNRVVTASLERMDFLTPIKPGELVILKASVNLAGLKSMEVGIKIEAEDLDTGHVRHAATCYMTFVAVDDNGKPIPVPPLELETEEDKLRYLKAKERRRYRDTMRGKVNQIHLHVSSDIYAICLCPQEIRQSLGSLLQQPELVLSMNPTSPAKLCPALDECSMNLQNVEPGILCSEFVEGMSLVVTQDALRFLPENSQINNGWRCLTLYGPNVMLSHTGILANLSSTLANANVSIFSISTFDGHFLLVKDELLETSVNTLRSKGYVVTWPHD